MGIIEWTGVSILFLMGCKLADKASDNYGKVQAVQKEE